MPGRDVRTTTPWRCEGPYDQSGVGRSGPRMNTVRSSTGLAVTTPQHAPFARLVEHLDTTRLHLDTFDPRAVEGRAVG